MRILPSVLRDQYEKEAEDAVSAAMTAAKVEDKKLKVDKTATARDLAASRRHSCERTSAMLMHMD